MIMKTIEKDNIKKIILDVENFEDTGGSSYVRFQLDCKVDNEHFGDFLWFGENNQMEIEIDNLDRYEEFEDENIEDYLSPEALEYIKYLKNEFNI